MTVQQESIGNSCVVKNVTNYNGETEAGAVRSTGTLKYMELFMTVME